MRDYVMLCIIEFHSGDPGRSQPSPRVEHATQPNRRLLGRRMKSMKGKPMQKLITLTRAFIFASVLAGTGALGQVPSLWTVDENGPALFQGPTFVGYANGTNRLDPVSGIVGWYYPLAAGLTNAFVPGDVVLFEPGTGTNFSDLLRFDGSGVFFFSDMEAGELNPDKADVPQMPFLRSPAVFLDEVGPEGHNGALYTPAPGQPGFDLSGVFPGVQYNIISDVPEPSSIAVVVGGTGLLICKAIRRRMKHGRGKTDPTGILA